MIALSQFLIYNNTALLLAHSLFEARHQQTLDARLRGFANLDAEKKGSESLVVV